MIGLPAQRMIQFFKRTFSVRATLNPRWFWMDAFTHHYTMRFFDRDGHALATVTDWARLRQDRTYCRVNLTPIADRRLISTVWLGIEHGFDGARPLIFETMVFSRSGPILETVRYATETEALTGHEAMIKRWTD